MKIFSDYTIYCTEEQTNKALELGAPLNTWGFAREPVIPTAEQMVGWLEEQEGVYDIHLLRTADGEWKYDVTTKCVSDNRMYGRCSSRKVATLAAIDAVLEYLTNKK